MNGNRDPREIEYAKQGPDGRTVDSFGAPLDKDNPFTTLFNESDYTKEPWHPKPQSAQTFPFEQPIGPAFLPDPMPLSEDKKRRIAALIAEQRPEHRPTMMQALAEKGISFDFYKYMPLSAEVEAEEFGKGVQEGITLGFYDAGPVNPRTGKIEILGEELSPSRTIGNAAGTMVPGIGAYGLAGKAVGALGVTNKIAARGLQVAFGEGLPGGMSGYIKNDGDIDKAIRVAAEWMAGGLILEGTFSAIVSGFKKVAAGKIPTPKERGALASYHGMAVDATQQMANDMPTPSTLAGEATHHNVKDTFIIEARKLHSGDSTISEFGAVTQQAVEDAFANLKDSIPDQGLKDAADMFSEFNAQMAARIRLKDLSSDQIDKQYGDFFKKVADYWNAGPQGAPKMKSGSLNVPRKPGQTIAQIREETAKFDEWTKGADKEPSWMVSEDDIAQRVGRGGQPKATRAIGKEYGPGERRPGDPAAVDDFSNSTTLDPDRVSSVASPTRKYNRGEQGTFHLHDDPRPLSGVVEEVSEDGFRVSVLDGADNERRSIWLTPQQVKRFDKKLENVSGGGGKEPIQPRASQEQLVEIATLRQQWKHVYGEDFKVSRPKGSPAGEVVTSSPTSSGGMKEVRTLSVRQARRLRRSMMLGIKQEQNRHLDLTAQKIFSEGDPLSRLDPSNPKIYNVDSRLPFAVQKVMPPGARYGMSTNPTIAAHTRWTTNWYEEVGRDTHKYLQRYQDALQGLLPTKSTSLKALLPGKRGGSARLEVHELNRKKILLARALDNSDDAARILKENPELGPAFQEIRNIFNELADVVGLPKGERITEYFPHIYHGEVGKWMAGEVGGELGSRGLWLHSGVAGDGVLPSERLFQHMLERKGGEGFMLDLDAAVYAYVRGAVKKPGMDEFLRRTRAVQREIPLRDAGGKIHTGRQLMDDWAKHIVGQPGSGRRAVAAFYEDNAIFNTYVSSLVEWLGGATEKGFLEQARIGRLTMKKSAMGTEIGTRGSYDLAAEMKAKTYFETLVRDANKYTREGILKNDLPAGKRRRAQLALKIEGIRTALENPNMKPIVISNLYGLMVVNKLGLNLSHGLINMTQTMTNTMPLLGIRGVTRGIKRYVGPDDFKFSSGKTKREVLEEMGVLSDTAEAQEFMRPGIGTWNTIIDEYVMSPARITEKFNRGVAGLGSYEQMLAKGMKHDEALILSRELVTKTQFPFNKAGQPAIMHAPLARLLLMFKTYPMHQINFSAELLVDALPVAWGGKGQMEPFIKHMSAYIAMAGVGATALGGTNFNFKAAHPIEDFTSIESERDVTAALGGPMASVFLDLLNAKYIEAGKETFVSTASERIAKTIERDESAGQSILTLSGMK